MRGLWRCWNAEERARSRRPYCLRTGLAAPPKLLTRYVDGERHRLDLTLALKLRPCAIATRLCEQAVERNLGSAARTAGDQPLVLTSRMRVNVAAQALANNQRMGKRAQVRLQVDDRLTGPLVRQRVGHADGPARDERGGS